MKTLLALLTLSLPLGALAQTAPPPSVVKVVGTADALAIQLQNTPLDVALKALEPHLPKFKFAFTLPKPMPMVTYSRPAVSAKQALADILKLVEPQIAVHIRGTGELEIRPRQPMAVQPVKRNEKTETLDIDFRDVRLDDAITALARQTRLENIVILPPATQSKVTLRLDNTTPKEALRRLCEACLPPVTLTAHDDGFYYIEPKK